MHKLKYLFLLILCVAAVGGSRRVAAQDAGAVLAAGGGQTLRQSDVDAVIEFYEWAFETSFTADQRERFEGFLTADFRRNPGGTRREIEEVTGTFARIRAADEDVRRKT